VKYVKGFAQFWYDFIVGDDWKIAAAIATTLAIGAVVASQTTTGAHWLAAVLGVALALAFVVSLTIDVRRS
jgi:hypothetical protein